MEERGKENMHAKKIDGQRNGIFIHREKLWRICVSTTKLESIVKAMMDVSLYNLFRRRMFLTLVTNL